MKGKMLKGLGIFAGIGFVIATLVLGYISYNQKNEIQYLREANALLQKDYEDTSKALKRTESEKEILETKNASLEEELETKTTELDLVNKALEIANDAINKLQANNTSNKDKDPGANDENENQAEAQEDTLTEKDLQTLKEKILAGEMNDYLKEVIGSMNKLELLKLAKEIGLL